MAFSKTQWDETKAITPERLNNMELQLEEAKAHTENHEDKDAPHAGHATKSELESHKNDSNAHAGTFVSYSALNNHVNADAPHSGHATSQEFDEHLQDRYAHSSYLVTQNQFSQFEAGFNNHTQGTAPHRGHVKGEMRITVSSGAPSYPSENDIWIVV